MEEKSKGKKTFWVNTRGIKLFRNKEVLSPPSWTKFRNSMSWDAVFSFLGLSFFSVLLFNSQIRKRWALFAFQESLNLKLMICIQSSTAEQIPPSLSCLFPFPPQWCQLNWLIEDHAFLFQYSMSFIPNLLMAGRGCTCDGGSVWLCCCGVLGTEEGRCSEGGKAEERSWDVILCFCCSHSLLQSGGRLASIISAVSLSPSPSLMRALVRSLARSLSALHTCTVLWRLILPLPYFFSSGSSQSEYDNCNVLRQFTAEINNYIKSLRLFPVCSGCIFCMRLYTCICVC